MARDSTLPHVTFGSTAFYTSARPLRPRICVPKQVSRGSSQPPREQACHIHSPIKRTPPNKPPNALSVIFHGGAFCAASPTHGIRSAALGGTPHFHCLGRPTCVIRGFLVESISVVTYVGFEISPRRFFPTPQKFMPALT